MQQLTPADPVRVGGYTLLARLGAGGMGQVYLGRSGAGQHAAVKVIHPALADDPGFRVRFRQEVDAARRVTGPATAAVLGAEPDADLPWLATAYVAGPSLAAVLAERGPLPADALHTLAAGLAEALVSIHDAGVVHRDLKPSNVLLTPGGPVVIDFGIARATDATALTSTGALIGSPGFMAPEQLQGEPVGPPADVFAFGVLLANAATGRDPFGTGPPAALLWRALHNEADLDGVPAEFAELVRTCLSPDPVARPSAQALRAALASATTQVWLPVDALRPQEIPPPRRRHGVRSRRAVLATAAVVLLGAGGVGYLVATNPGQQQRADPPTTAPTAAVTTAAVRPPPYAYSGESRTCTPQPDPWPDARWLGGGGPPRVRSGTAVPLEVRDKFGLTGDYTYPMQLTVTVYEPAGTSTIATVTLDERAGVAAAEVIYPGSFVGAAAAYRPGTYTVLWTYGDKVLTCDGFVAVG